ncbi:hypothetical protein F2Q68_00020566 [Brassica cretica]|uniref:Uncharacterized protein n=1 Tax=Brassica cretica TaxID=69181 RepID=A0A8S9FUZ6_BRACR|nr:hypothetical protein F2Q68_00020566 [Brassica cretica]
MMIRALMMMIRDLAMTTPAPAMTIRAVSARDRPAVTRSMTNPPRFGMGRDGTVAERYWDEVFKVRKFAGLAGRVPAMMIRAPVMMIRDLAMTTPAPAMTIRALVVF